MRFYEISSGLRMPVSEEEQHLIDRGIQDHTIRACDLNERGEEVARLMVTRGLLDPHHDDKGGYYTVNSCVDLWRF